MENFRPKIPKMPKIKKGPDTYSNHQKIRFWKKKCPSPSKKFWNYFLSNLHEFEKNNFLKNFLDFFLPLPLMGVVIVNAPPFSWNYPSWNCPSLFLELTFLQLSVSFDPFVLSVSSILLSASIFIHMHTTGRVLLDIHTWTFVVISCMNNILNSMHAHSRGNCAVRVQCES